ncbi:MAG: A/G-specific adenine glycosylase [Thermoplasmatota archaeon]
MLQQTRVAAALPFFGRWMERFPTVQDLAAAPEEEVLRLWSGLGYYSRARSLHRAAKIVCKDNGGRLPRDAAALQRLPGIGPYTAAAIASIAFGAPVPAIDGNVVRVACRVAGIRQDPRAAATRRRVEESVAAWVPRAVPGDWNQAVMELGATVCTPVPRCGGCSPPASRCCCRIRRAASRSPAAPSPSGSACGM